MATREPVQLVEIDMDYCPLSYGVGACSAALGSTGVRKCYNTYETCQRKPVFGNPVEPTTRAFTRQNGQAIELTDFSTGATSSSVTFAIDLVTPTTYSEQTILEIGSSTNGIWFGFATVATSTETLYLGIGQPATGFNNIIQFVDAEDYLGVQGTFYIVIDTASPNTVTLWFWNYNTATLTKVMEDDTEAIDTWASGDGGLVGDEDTNALVSRGPFQGTLYQLRAYEEAFTPVAPTRTKTLKFITPTANIPKDGNVYFPAVKAVSAFSTSVNLGGSSPEYGKLGRRARVKIDLTDFPYHDRFLDKYQSERVDGTAQTDEGGYDPGTRGTFFTKLKSRFPFYAGRPLRVIDGYVDGGVFTELQRRHFIITDVTGPDNNNMVSFEAKDILTLAEKKSAVAPKASNGELLADITAAAGSLTLTPTGIGNLEYPTSGYAVISDEVVSFTRSGDTVTLTGRGQRRTTASDHSAGDTFQLAVDYVNQNVDDVVADLLTNYTDIDTSFLPTTDWATEVDRWMPTVLLSTTITEPTSVADLVGELSDLGVSIYWDDVAQEIKLKVTSPLDLDETAIVLTDDTAIKKLTQKDDDRNRITQVHFYSVQTNPTQSHTEKSNYDRLRVQVDTESQGINAFNDTKIKEVYFRWFNNGADNSVRSRSNSLLQRFNRSPRKYFISLDAKDIDIQLTDVLEVTSRLLTDETGNPVTKRLEVIQKSEPVAGHSVEIVAQEFNYGAGRFAYIMDNYATDYDATATTETDRDTGAFIVDSTTLEFDDFTGPYIII